MPAPWYQRVHLPQGIPTPNPDTPVTSVFLVIYFLCALTNIFIFRRNAARGHKFIISGLLTGFNMARTITCSLRLAWIYFPHDRNIAIASTIFNAAGVLILFIVNLIFAQRVFRGLHPKLGWNKPLSMGLKVMYGMIPLLLVMVIVVTIQSFFATSPHTISIDHSIQLAPSTYFAIVAVLPAFIVIFALVWPRDGEVDHFGKHHLYLKAGVVLTASVLLATGAWFRMLVAYVGKDPHAWYQHVWAFYFFQFTVEVLTVFLFIGLRVDLTFHIPNGSRGPYSYTNGRQSQSSGDMQSLPSRVGSEVEQKEKDETV